MDKWVFVPGYYQGKTPWGIYVGKTAYTHYDFDVYEDYDRDYAFVTVYNGIQIGGGTAEEGHQGRVRQATTGIKEAKDIEITAAEFRACKLDPDLDRGLLGQAWRARLSRAGPDFPERRGRQGRGRRGDVQDGPDRQGQRRASSASPSSRS